MDRLRLVLGAILATVGIFVIVIVGSFSVYTDIWVWAIGLLLLVGGVLIAGSQTLVNFLADITRW